MKKIILILITLIISGCYDYKDLKELSLVSTIGIAQKEDKYEVYFEIINNNEDNDSYVIKTTDKDLSKAFTKLNNKVISIPYFYQIKTVIFSNTLKENNIQEINDYILRSTDIKNEFTICYTYNDIKDILKNKDKSNKITGQYIQKLTDNNKNALYKGSYSNFIKDLYNDDKDAYLPVIKLKNKKLSLSGIELFENSKPYKLLNDKQASILNILINQKNNLTLSVDNLSIQAFQTSKKYHIKKNKLIIDLNIQTEILNDNSKTNLKKQKSYQKINKATNKKIKKMITNLLRDIPNYKKIIGYNDIYYKKSNNKTYTIEFNIKSKVNKKGLIFEVSNEN